MGIEISKSLPVRLKSSTAFDASLIERLLNLPKVKFSICTHLDLSFNLSPSQSTHGSSRMNCL